MSLLKSIQKKKEYKKVLEDQLLYLKTLPLKKCDHLTAEIIPVVTSENDDLFCSYTSMTTLLDSLFRDCLSNLGMYTDAELIDYLDRQNHLYHTIICQTFGYPYCHPVNIKCDELLSAIHEIRLIDIDAIKSQDLTGEQLCETFLQLPANEQMAFFQKLGSFEFKLITKPCSNEDLAEVIKQNVSGSVSTKE